MARRNVQGLVGLGIILLVVLLPGRALTEVVSLSGTGLEADIGVTGTSARLNWAAATGPVAGYSVYVARNGADFPAKPTARLAAPTATSFTVHGDVGGTVRIRVAAFDAASVEGPPSPDSQEILFLGDGSSLLGDSAGDGSAGDSPAASAPAETTSDASSFVLDEGGNGSLLAEVGQVEVRPGGVRVELTRTYSDPVVVLGPPSDEDDEAGVVRVENVDEGSFDLFFEEWPHLDGAHGRERVSYLVAERGRYHMSDGSVWEVDRLRLEGDGAWTSWRFASAFDDRPVLLLSSQTRNGPEPVVLRVRGLTARGFEVATFEEEASSQRHTTEHAGYIAAYSPRGSGSLSGGVDSLPYMLDRILVDDRYMPVLSTQIYLQEEQSADDELAHSEEEVGFLALGPYVFAQELTAHGSDPVALRVSEQRHSAQIEWGSFRSGPAWQTVPLARSYDRPVVVARMASAKDPVHALVEVRDVRSNSFQAHVREWGYQDGRHARERAFYMVAEAGVHQLAGLQVEAGRLETARMASNGPVQVDLNRPRVAPPAVFTGLMSANGEWPVTTRAAAPTAGSLAIWLFREEASGPVPHPLETVGWIAIEPGSGLTSDGRWVGIRGGSVDHRPLRVEFGVPLRTRLPLLLANVASLIDRDTVVFRYRDLGAMGATIWLQEEVSRDSETSHALEPFSLFMAD